MWKQEKQNKNFYNGVLTEDPVLDTCHFIVHFKIQGTEAQRHKITCLSSQGPRLGLGIQLLHLNPDWLQGLHSQPVHCIASGIIQYDIYFLMFHVNLYKFLVFTNQENTHQNVNSGSSLYLLICIFQIFYIEQLLFYIHET